MLNFQRSPTSLSCGHLSRCYLLHPSVFMDTPVADIEEGEADVVETEDDDVELENGDPTQCVICLEALSKGHLSCLTCGHVFHRVCLMLALETTQRCPVCRAKCSTTNRSLSQHFPHPIYVSQLIAASENEAEMPTYAESIELESMRDEVRQLVSVAFPLHPPLIPATCRKHVCGCWKSKKKKQEKPRTPCVPN